MRKVNIGECYRHFKGKNYVVKDIVNDCESIGDKLDKVVIYQALYGDKLTWARKYEEFTSEVDHIKYPDVTQKYRCEKISPEYTDIDINAYLILNYEVNYSKKPLDNFIESLNTLGINVNVLNKKDDDNRLPINDVIFENIRKSNFIIIDYNEENRKLPIYLEHARSNGIPVYIINKKGIMIPLFVKDLSTDCIQYDTLDQLYTEFEQRYTSKTLKIKYQ